MIAKEGQIRDSPVTVRELDSPQLVVLDLIYRQYGFCFYPGKQQPEGSEVIVPIHGVIPIRIRDAVTHKERQFSYSFERLGAVRLDSNSYRILEKPARHEILRSMNESRAERWRNISERLLFSAPDRFGQSLLIRHALIPVRTIADTALRDEQISIAEVEKPRYLSLMEKSGLLYKINEETYGPSRDLIEIYDREKDFKIVGFYAIGLVVAHHYDQLRLQGIHNIQPWISMSTSYYEKAIGCDYLVTLDRREFLESFVAERYRSRWKKLRAETWLTGLQKAKIFASGENVTGQEDIFDQVRNLRPSLHIIA